MKARPVVNAEGEVVRVIGALSDVTEIKTAEERMLHDAVHDNLTGLPNRELFFDRLEYGADRSAETRRRRPAVMVIDIDRFKADQRGDRSVVRRFGPADGRAAPRRAIWRRATRWRVWRATSSAPSS
jgi:predicted signal transduction protein with EAL and GGDEF domain